MLKGRRPARPNHHQLSDHMWKMIRWCWKAKPAQRVTIAEIVTALEAEVSVRESP